MHLQALDPTVSPGIGSEKRDGLRRHMRYVPDWTRSRSDKMGLHHNPPDDNFTGSHLRGAPSDIMAAPRAITARGWGFIALAVIIVVSVLGGIGR